MTKIFLLLATFLVLATPVAAGIPNPKVVVDDPQVLDGNFGWWISTDGSCLVSGAPGTESVAAFRWGGNSWTLSDRILPPSVEAGAQFGRRHAISEDGKTLAVCAPFDDQFGSDAGVLFLYEGPGDCTFPSLVQTLKGSDTNQFDQFCSSVDFNSDGLAVAVGAAYADKVYEFSRASLGQQFGSEKKFQYLGDDAGGLPGYSVCLDGNVGDNMLLAIGIPIAWSEAGGDDWFGRVEVREKNRGGTNNWGVRNGITFANAERIGWSLGCSRGDNLVIAGAPIDMTAGGSSGFVPETTGQGRGAVYVTRLEGVSSFSLVQKLISEDPQSDGEFGRVVAYDKFDKQLLITAPFNDIGALENMGRSQTYRWNGSSFVQKDSLIVLHTEEFEEYGLSGAAARGRVFIGSPFADIGGPLDSGVVFAYYNPLFSDGFESGSTTAWSATIP